jgi:hypothetical protein
MSVVAVLAIVDGLRVALAGQTAEERLTGWYLVGLGVVLIATTLLAARQGTGAASGSADPSAAEAAPETTASAAESAALGLEGDTGARPTAERRPDTPTASDVAAGEGAAAGTAPADRRVTSRVAGFLALVAGYIVALPWIGFAATNGLFLVLYLKFVAGYGWGRTLGYALVIDAVSVFFFTRVGVILPTGPFRY